MTETAICFDLDDTLYDYHHYARAGLESAAALVEARTGKRVHDELERLYFDEDVSAGTFDVLLDRHDLPGVTVDDLVKAFHDSTGDLETYEETVTVLDALGRDHALGLITDGRGGHGKLERLGIREHFDSVLVTPTIGSSKQQRDVFERVLDDLEVDPRAATYVGDDPRVDFRVPNELGMGTIRLRRGRYTHLDPEEDAGSPDREIESLDALLDEIGVDQVVDTDVDGREVVDGTGT